MSDIRTARVILPPLGGACVKMKHWCDHRVWRVKVEKTQSTKIHLESIAREITFLSICSSYILLILQCWARVGGILCVNVRRSISQNVFGVLAANGFVRENWKNCSSDGFGAVQVGGTEQSVPINSNIRSARVS